MDRLSSASPLSSPLDRVLVNGRPTVATWQLVRRIRRAERRIRTDAPARAPDAVPRKPAAADQVLEQLGRVFKPGDRVAGVRWPRPPASRFPRPARSGAGHAPANGPTGIRSPASGPGGRKGAGACAPLPLRRQRRTSRPIRIVIADAGPRILSSRRRACWRRTLAGTAASPGGGPCDRDGERR